jgi:hypothetical protein
MATKEGVVETMPSKIFGWYPCWTSNDFSKSHKLFKSIVCQPKNHSKIDHVNNPMITQKYKSSKIQNKSPS